jgi:hypothetical protein
MGVARVELHDNLITLLPQGIPLLFVKESESRPLIAQ